MGGALRESRGTAGRWTADLRRLAILVAGGLLACGSPSGAQAPAPAPLALDRGDLRVVYWPGDEALAERTLEAARTPLPLPGLPAAAGRITGTILLAPTPALFDSLTGRAPGWSAGVAIPSERRIILPAFQSARTPIGDPIVALRHEIAHLALNAYLPGHIPRWFDEGYATWVSGGWDESSGWQIRLALLRGEGPVLDSLTLGWPLREAQARLAYLLSASAVRFLATRGSERAFPAFLERWRREGSFDAALRSVYQLTPSQFEREWRAMVRRRYGWLLALSQAGVFWAAIALLLILLGSLRRRRNRERLEAMRAEERMLPPPRPDGVDEDYPLL